MHVMQQALSSQNLQLRKGLHAVVVVAAASHGLLPVSPGDDPVPSGVGLGATVADILLQVVPPSPGHHQGRRDGRGGTGASHGGLPAQAPLP